MNNKGFIEEIILVIIGIIVILFICAIGVSYHHFSKVYNSKNQEELKQNCLSDWYKNGSLDSVPAQCRKFYSQGIEIK